MRMEVLADTPTAERRHILCSLDFLGDRENLMVVES